jgi:glucose/arabinose dehydrogenase
MQLKKLLICKTIMKMTALFYLTCSILLGICTPYAGEQSLQLDKVRLPKGFKIELYADKVPNARSMVWGDNGTLFVGTRSEGKVYAVVDKDKDFKADQVYIIASGLNMPNGVAFRNGSLYVAEVSRVIRYDNIENNLSNPPKPVVVNASFPTDEHHGWKYIAFGPDGKLYVPVGAPCNICESEDKRFASIMRMDPDGGNLEVYAHGVRNTVGFAWHPASNELWFTDNGGDMLGDDKPADELNHAPNKDMHFGYPYCHEGGLADEKYGKGRNCADYVFPAMKLGPHVAALGMKFYTGNMFPSEYKDQVFIAEHGSWNRSKPIGYRITMVTMKDGKAAEYKVFAEGWLQGNKAWGRPVDVLQMPDGSLLVSDDDADVIYRISYSR